MSDFDKNDICSSIDFLPPEYFKHMNLGEKSDIWSIGILTYFLISGHLPFSFDNVNIAKRICNGLTDDYYNDEIWKNISNECIDFIKQTTQLLPEDRKCIKELINHPFITKTFNDIDLSYNLPFYKMYKLQKNSIKEKYNKTKRKEFFDFSN